MTRPAVEVAALLHAQGNRFIEQNRSWLSFQQLSVLRAMQRCRTAALGGHIDHCSQCRHRAISYNSCRNRHCPKCQAQARERWLAARGKELLGVPYFHVVFTLPHELNPLCARNAKLIYNLLFQAGGFSPNRQHWIHPKYNFFLPVKVLGRVFRGKFMERLQRAHQRKELDLSGVSAPLGLASGFQSLVNRLFAQDWVVYAKRAFGGPDSVLRYLGRYTHRVAISNHRLVAFDGERVTFRWKDYSHGNKQKLMTLPATEFLRRCVQHVAVSRRSLPINANDLNRHEARLRTPPSSTRRC